MYASVVSDCWRGCDVNRVFLRCSDRFSAVFRVELAEYVDAIDMSYELVYLGAEQLQTTAETTTLPFFLAWHWLASA